jgi:hypothetical protein
MPLHTAAAHVPSAAQIAVSAGLAERGPNGTLLYANPPVSAASITESVQREFVIQRAEEADASSSGNGSGAGGGVVVSRATEEAPSVSPEGAPDGEETLQDEAQKLADQARRLYPHIRSQLESDIRRQLEARNRAGRYNL